MKESLEDATPKKPAAARYQPGRFYWPVFCFYRNRLYPLTEKPEPISGQRDVPMMKNQDPDRLKTVLDKALKSPLPL